MSIFQVLSCWLRPARAVQGAVAILRSWSVRVPRLVIRYRSLYCPTALRRVCLITISQALTDVVAQRPVPTPALTPFS